jgi:hypothetical protein
MASASSRKIAFFLPLFFVAETWRTYAIRTSPTSPTQALWPMKSLVFEIFFSLHFG